MGPCAPGPGPRPGRGTRPAPPASGRRAGRRHRPSTRRPPASRGPDPPGPGRSHSSAASWPRAAGWASAGSRRRSAPWRPAGRRHSGAGWKSVASPIPLSYRTVRSYCGRRYSPGSHCVKVTIPYGWKKMQTTTKPRPDRPRLDRDARREAILDVAQDVFLEEGFANASMSTIAARLGGSKGTLYNYFKSKDDLFNAYVERRCLWQDEIFAPPPDNETPPQTPRPIGRAHLTPALTHFHLPHFRPI